MDWVALIEGVPEIQVSGDEGVVGTPLTIVEVVFESLLISELVLMME
jgi:hypothetical protein